MFEGAKKAQKVRPSPALDRGASYTAVSPFSNSTACDSHDRVVAQAWARTPLWKRAEYLHKVDGLMKANAQPMADALVKEVIDLISLSITLKTFLGVCYCSLQLGAHNYVSL